RSGRSRRPSNPRPRSAERVRPRPSPRRAPERLLRGTPAIAVGYGTRARRRRGARAALESRRCRERAPPVLVARHAAGRPAPAAHLQRTTIDRVLVAIAVAIVVEPVASRPTVVTRGARTAGDRTPAPRTQQ